MDVERVTGLEFLAMTEAEREEVRAALRGLPRRVLVAEHGPEIPLSLRGD